MTYSTSNFLSDIKGYGTVLAAYINRSEVFDDNVPKLTSISNADITTFTNLMYAYVSIGKDLTIYRWYDDDKAGLVGGFWSPQRPSAEIDNISLSETHKNSRHHLALKKEWNKMFRVVEATLCSGTIVILGRTAKQFDSDRLLGGGAIQFLVPRTSFAGLHITRNHKRR